MVKDTPNTDKLNYGDISVVQLLEKARLVAFQAQDPYKQIVEVYYIARYFMSWFESRETPEVPIQVWNEYRMAMDHFMRSLTSEEAENEAQLRRMDAHLQRAALDVLKLLFTSMSDSCGQFFKGYSAKAVNTLESGEFRTKATRLSDCAQLQYHKAKLMDSESKASGSFDIYSLEDRCPGIAAYAEAVMLMFEYEGYLKAKERHVASLESELQRSSSEGLLRGRAGFWAYSVVITAFGAFLPSFWGSFMSVSDDAGRIDTVTHAEVLESLPPTAAGAPVEVFPGSDADLEPISSNTLAE